MGRKDLVMRNQRRFPPELKRSIIEELLSQTSTAAQICRRHNISSGLLYRWKRQYARGKFGNEPTKEAALADRVEQLERLVGQLTLEKELFRISSAGLVEGGSLRVATAIRDELARCYDGKD
jgi:transposase